MKSSINNIIWNKTLQLNNLLECDINNQEFPTECLAQCISELKQKTKPIYENIYLM